MLDDETIRPCYEDETQLGCKKNGETHPATSMATWANGAINGAPAQPGYEALSVLQVMQEVNKRIEEDVLGTLPANSNKDDYKLELPKWKDSGGTLGPSPLGKNVIFLRCPRGGPSVLLQNIPDGDDCSCRPSKQQSKEGLTSRQANVAITLEQYASKSDDLMAQFCVRPPARPRNSTCALTYMRKQQSIARRNPITRRAAAKRRERLCAAPIREQHPGL